MTASREDAEEKLAKAARRRMLAETKRVPGLSAFLGEIDKHVYKAAQLTFSYKGEADVRTETWDINRNRRDGRLVFGASPSLWPEFYGRFVEAASGAGFLPVILRSFTNEVDEETGLPVKELRGYVVRVSSGRGLTYEQVSARELAEANNKDPRTGMPLEPEPAVVYVGKGGERLNDVFISI